MDMENQNETNAPEKPHKRRIRYSGTHPKTYKEKYKEHQPEKYVDMIERGIIDPTKVTRSALQNAASVAAMVLTTESLVADIPAPEPAAPAGGAAGGMGGMY